MWRMCVNNSLDASSAAAPVRVRRIRRAGAAERPPIRRCDAPTRDRVPIRARITDGAARTCDWIWTECVLFGEPTGALSRCVRIDDRNHHTMTTTTTTTTRPPTEISDKLVHTKIHTQTCTQHTHLTQTIRSDAGISTSSHHHHHHHHYIIKRIIVYILNVYVNVLRRHPNPPSWKRNGQRIMPMDASRRLPSSSSILTIIRMQPCTHHIGCETDARN